MGIENGMKSRRPNGLGRDRKGTRGRGASRAGDSGTKSAIKVGLPRNVLKKNLRSHPPQIEPKIENKRDGAELVIPETGLVGTTGSRLKLLRIFLAPYVCARDRSHQNT